MRAAAFLLLLFAALAPARAQEAPRLSLVTFAPGEIYWQRFGHNALLVRENGRALVYNYGVFDFRQKNFFLNFARGRMIYRLDVDMLDRTVRQYRAEGRWIYEQELALGPQQARQLADFLAENAQPENAEYRYDYFVSNCSTRVRDALELALQGALKTQLEARGTAQTYRSEVLRLMSPEPVLMLGMDLGLGPRVDRASDAWQQSFIPMTLMDVVRSVRVADAAGALRPLVAAERWLARTRQPEPPAQPPQLLGRMALAGLLCAAALLGLTALRRFAAARVLLGAAGFSLSLVAGIGGLVLLAAWAFAEHWGMRGNQNLLLLDPLALLLLPAWAGMLRAAWRPSLWQMRLAFAIAGVAALAAALKLLPGLPLQHNLHWVVFWFLVHAALAASLWRAHRKKVIPAQAGIQSGPEAPGFPLARE